MTESSVAERVMRVFSEFKKVPREDIKMDTTFAELGLDSLDGLNLIFELEEEFNVMIPDDKVESMKSVSEVVDGIQWLLDHPQEQSNVGPKTPAAQPTE
ncbi:MAG TPA: phosphopantetheine-binding protein [Pyrinomonadaceae bacterium]|jgi:acyl carrier protein